MLSIVIPVYNVENYLKECLDSILKNCVCDWECILVDDGSQDNSGKICDEYARKEERFKVIHQTNKGVSSARNAGIESAKGDRISFVDSDDMALCGYGECCNNKETADLIYFPHEGYSLDEFYSKERNEIEKEILYLKHNDQQFEFFGYTWNKFFRADIIREHGIRFPENLKHREDEYFTAEYCRYIKSLKVINQPLYHYRVDDSFGHLTNRMIGPNELMVLADNILGQIDIWQTKELRSYELFRAARLMYDALRKTTNPINQLQIARKIATLAKDKGHNIDSSMLPIGMTKVWNKPLALVIWINYKKICQKF